jgi:transposase
VDRAASGRRYPIPYKVELSAGNLEYWWEDDEVIGRVGPPDWPRQADEQLSEFIHLASADDERIVEFARRFGVLRLCNHWRPATHALGTAKPCFPLGADAEANYGREPTWPWRFYARQAVALLNVCARLRDGRAALEADWSWIYDRSGPIMAPYRRLEQDPATGEARVSAPIDPRTGEEDEWGYEPLDEMFGAAPPISACALDIQRWCAQSVIAQWLYPAWPEIIFEWEAEHPSLGLSTPRLWDILALKIVLAAGLSDGIAICSACGRPYLPDQQPKAGRRSYCPECRALGKPQRDASRDYRRAQRLAAGQWTTLTSPTRKPRRIVARRNEKAPAAVTWAETQQELYERYRTERDVDRRKRLQALWLVRSGKGHEDAAHATGVDEQTVDHWVQWYRIGGLEAVLGRVPGHGGRRSQCRRSTAEHDALVAECAAGGIRSFDQARSWVQEQCGTSYSYQGMYALLRRLGVRLPRSRHAVASADRPGRGARPTHANPPDTR